MSKRRVKQNPVVVFLIVMMVSINPVLASVTYKWTSTGECSGNFCIWGPPEASWVFSDSAVENGVARNLTPGEVLAFEYDIGVDSLRMTNSDHFPHIWRNYQITFNDDRTRIAYITTTVFPTSGADPTVRHFAKFTSRFLDVGIRPSSINQAGLYAGGTSTSVGGYWAVPAPSAVYLFGSGLVTLIGLRRCKKSRLRPPPHRFYNS